MSSEPIRIPTAAARDTQGPEPVPDVVESPADTIAASDIAAAPNAALAAKLRAKHQQLLNRSKKIPMPPEDVWGGDLVLVVKSVELKEGTPFVALIADATLNILARDDATGELQPIDGGWQGVAELMGVAGEGVTIGQIIHTVCGGKDVVSGLAEQIMSFILGRQSKIERALGE